MKVQTLKIRRYLCQSSKPGGHTAAAKIEDSMYLGEYATVMDAEMLGIALVWKHHSRVVTDSHGAIGRITVPTSKVVDRTRGHKSAGRRNKRLVLYL